MSATLLPNGTQQFLNASGTPLAGGKVYMYVPSTTTFKNTWQDVAQNVLNTNPIILNAAGEAIIYGVGAYRQVVFDNLGNTIWDAQTQDLTSVLQGQVTLWCGTSGGTANAITLTPNPAVTALIPGQNFEFIGSNSNTGATTVNISGLGAHVLVDNLNPLVANNILAGNINLISWDGTQFQLLAPQTQLLQTFNNDIFIKWKDSSGTAREALGWDNNNIFHVGDVQNVVTGSKVEFDANTVFNWNLNGTQELSFTEDLFGSFGLFFGSGVGFEVTSVNFNGMLRGSGSGNVSIIQNVSGASSYDSALSFNDGQTNLHTGAGVEHGAIGWHEGSEFPFDNSMFIEVSNDPASGATTNPPSMFAIIQTGFLNGAYASRARYRMKTDGSIQFFDASSVGLSDGVPVITIPDLAGTGVGINILGVGGSGTPSQNASFEAVGLDGVAANSFASCFFGASDSVTNNLVFMGLHGVRTADTTYKLFDYADQDGAGTSLWRVLANGDTYNHNGVYGTLSDEREKTKQGEMPSLIEIYPQIELGRYKFNNQLESEVVRYGPFAQQLLSVIPPELESNLISEVENPSGEKRLTLNTNAFNILTAKALQEAIAKINSYEERISKLENILVKLGENK